MGGDGSTERDDPLTVAWQRSRSLERWRSLADRALAGASGSRTTAVLGRVRWLAATSGLYRWFTTEPPEGRIVIDLRDSRFVGPFVPAVTGFFHGLERAWNRSAANRGVRALGHPLRDAPVRAASAFVLLLVGASVVTALQRPTAIGSGPLAILAGFALLGIREGRSWSELRETRVGRALSSLVQPPSDGTQR